MSYQELSIFFFDELAELNDKYQEQISIGCIGYLSELLLKGLNKEFLFERNQKKYLFDLYTKAVQAEGNHERFLCLKNLGDYSLFVSGYFTENFTKKVSVKYYIDMGSEAYRQASHFKYKEPYSELSENYKYCLSLINEISERQKQTDNLDLIKMYDFWSLTGSLYVKRKLLKLGFITEIIKG